MFKLIQSVFKRVVTAVTSPFRVVIVRIQRMFNINIITAKLITPLTKKVKSLITLKPQSREDYYVIGKHWVFKKLFLTLILVLCAGVLLYFTMFAPPLQAAAPVAAVATTVSFPYDDMALRKFTGVANIRAADGKVVYTGDIDAGVCKGAGSLYDRSGKLLYAGQFDQNKYNGKGISYYPSGKTKYEGEFADNLYQGPGNLYSPEGVLVYTGDFSGGVYSGAGKLYSAPDVLLYDGSFANGKYHGDGVLYYDDGTTKYEGSFFQGMMQGKGVLYNPTGKLLYTGDVYDNTINYRSLVHSTLADLEKAFAETPRIFYTDTDSAFVYEQAGVIVTTSCRVLVDTWQKPAAEQDDRDQYYMPGASSAVSPPPLPLASLPGSMVQTAQVTPLSTTSNRPATSNLSFSGNGRRLSPTPMEWYVANGSGDSSQGNSSSSSSPPSSSSSSSSSGASGPPEITVVVPSQGESHPDFVQKSNTLYFEIDKDVWQSEADLDKSKVQIQKITVFNNEIGVPSKGAVEFSDDIPPSMEDCVAIDFIRQQKPTAFPQVVFEMDNQNHLFIRLSNINFASSIRSRAYLSEGLTYRYCYPSNPSNSSNGERPLFFSIER